MQCLAQQTDGSFVIGNPQPVEYTTCTYVLAQPSDLSSFDKLTAAQGTQIAMAIALLWAVGATFRIIISFLKPNGVNENE